MTSTSPSAWEEAYLRFETSDQETGKFLKRLRAVGAESWPPDERVVELFCGRANGVRALRETGIEQVAGIDLSLALVSRYNGPAQLYVGDCRALPFADESRDTAVVQGGLHHLPVLPDDLEQTLAEAHRVLRPGGRLVVIEPWSTPFLKVVHRLCTMRWLRRLWGKLDDLAIMIEHERLTYEAWLRQPDQILSTLSRYFTTERCTIRLGKLLWVGRKPGSTARSAS